MQKIQRPYLKFIEDVEKVLVYGTSERVFYIEMLIKNRKMLLFRSELDDASTFRELYLSATCRPIDITRKEMVYAINTLLDSKKVEHVEFKPMRNKTYPLRGRNCGFNVPEEY